MANTKRNTTVIEWPSDKHFTIEDAQRKYPSMINITLRFRLQKAIDNNEISVIGKIKPAIGRPRLVFAKANSAKSVLEAATASGVLPFSVDKKAEVGVTDVKVEVVKTPTTVATPVAKTQTAQVAV